MEFLRMPKMALLPIVCILLILVSHSSPISAARNRWNMLAARNRRSMLANDLGATPPMGYIYKYINLPDVII